MRRRDFLKAAVAGTTLARGRFPRGSGGSPPPVSLVADPADPIAAAKPAQWALAELAGGLAAAGAAVRRLDHAEAAGADDLCIVASGAAAPVAAAALERSGARAPDVPESLVLLRTRVAGRRAILACAVDARGLGYALLDLTDQVRAGAAPTEALAPVEPAVERPACAVRSVMRQFTSQTLDTPWYRDREGWKRYLAMLAAHRFNRLHLAFGFGYDSLQGVADSYFLFAYPFLLDVPGYAVQVTNLPDAERDRNLATLRFISDEAAARGLEFELGIWTHGYRLTDSPGARYVIEGLTPETHRAYCRDALTAVLRACPAITAVGLRIHGESGVAEGSYDFWSAVFEGAARCGRAVELDLHAKGLDDTMIRRALATGMPVNVSPKFAAEHLGLPYHQAAIRALEMPIPGKSGAGLMTLSEGSRVFTRYGYADFLKEGRRYTVRPRVFSGTQRLLAWGDPATAAAGARAFRFCGMTGADLMEPLTCRGRRGTAAGRRDGYVDERLLPRWDLEKYGAWYRAWGRMTYDPGTVADVFHRALGVDRRALALESALARASRILPVVTTAHLPSAACDAYWPEICWCQPMAAEPSPNPYVDTPWPRTFQHASPLDPQLFSSPAEAADELLRGETGARYSPLEVARWLEDLAGDALGDLARAGAQVSPERLRLAIDIEIVAGLGRFFSAKLRSGVLYAIHERTRDRRALVEALIGYRLARDVWTRVVERARGIYQADLSASDRFQERGQWADRLAGIGADIDALASRVGAAVVSTAPGAKAAVVAALTARPRTPAPAVHEPPPAFRPRFEVPLVLKARDPVVFASVRLHYRRVNQAERWLTAEASPRAGAWRVAIPAAYTLSEHPLQYYFEVQGGPGRVWLHPGFEADLLNQPYYVLRRVG